MSRDVDIFIRREGVTLAQFSAELSQSLDLPLFPAPDTEYFVPHFVTSMYGADDRWRLALSVHDLVDDGELNFTWYPFELAIEGSVALKDEICARVFAILKARTSYQLLAVDDVERVLDRRD